MYLTPDQLRQNAAAMVAFAEGKPFQFRSVGTKEWLDYDTSRMRLPDYKCWEYRPKPGPKPGPKARYWSKPEDVPLNCWIGYSNGRALVLCVSTDGVKTQYHNYAWSELKGMKHSTDLKTWHKCEVNEEA
jgi:hypothetical protein